MPCYFPFWVSPPGKASVLKVLLSTSPASSRNLGRCYAAHGKALFINADADYHAGRAQNYLRPEHVEKIVSTFQAFADVPGYAAVVSHR